MPRRSLLPALALTLVATAVPSSAGPLGTAVAPPAGAISAGVEYVTTLPEMRTAIAINFLGDTMVVSTTTGLFTYDVSDPRAPQLLGALPEYIWENEDVDVDPVRKRVFISRDPRGFTTPATPGALFPFGAVEIIDVSNPRTLVRLGTFPVPAGHTTTCVNRCDFVWTAGPYANAQTQPQYVGRPVYATDVRDPLRPVSCPEPINLGNNDGVTGYSHDVQVDAAGVAWVSGEGGVRGFWTEGVHRNPLTGKDETATACRPVPYAGSGSPTAATPTRFMHNSWRTTSATVDGRPGDVLYATEENVTSNCATAGRFATYDLRGTHGGEGFRDTATTKHRMTALDTWTPEKQPGSDGCASAHYFADRGDGLLAAAFYGQGTRFLDVSDPRDVRQVAYYRPDDASTWAAYWHKGYVFVADNARGVDVVRLTGTPGSAPAAAPAVAAPASVSTSDLLATVDPDLSLCRTRTT